MKLKLGESSAALQEGAKATKKVGKA